MSPVPVTVVPVSRFTVPAWAPAAIFSVELVAFSSMVMVWACPLARLTVDLGAAAQTSLMLPDSVRARPSSCPSTVMRARP